MTTTPWHVVLVTGSRAAPRTAVDTIRERLVVHHAEANGRKLVLVHGNCPPPNQQKHPGRISVDHVADHLVRKMSGVRVFAAPALWEGRNPCVEGPERNADMVELLVALRQRGHAVHCEAFPTRPTGGTRTCIKLARAAGIWTHVTELGGEHG